MHMLVLSCLDPDSLLPLSANNVWTLVPMQPALQSPLLTHRCLHTAPRVQTMYKAAQMELAVLHRLGQADQENRKHCIRLLRYFEYRNHMCLVGVHVCAYVHTCGWVGVCERMCAYVWVSVARRSAAAMQFSPVSTSRWCLAGGLWASQHISLLINKCS